MPQFTPTREAGLARLGAVASALGRDYAAGRNTDRGPDAPGPSTSALSPWLRHGLVLDEEAIRAALDAHGAQGAGKFVERWRGAPTSRAGWRAARRCGTPTGTKCGATATGSPPSRACAASTTTPAPADRHRLLRRLGAGRRGARLAAQPCAHVVRVRLDLHLAPALDLGREFFLRHLLDGDPASNTLSWRWVGGLHTRGKHYVARAENIARYTDGRYDPAGQLDENPAPLPPDDVPPHRLPPSPPLAARPRAGSRCCCTRTTSRWTGWTSPAWTSRPWPASPPGPARPSAAARSP
jgi:deoxyribodipyrimidine photo-lyase